MLINLPVLILVVLTMIILGFLPLTKNLGNKSYLYFSASCFFLAAWVVTNYLAETDILNSLLWTRLTFTSIIIGLLSFLLFSNSFPREVVKSRYVKGAVIAGCMGMLYIATKSQFIPDVEITDSISTVVTGPYYVFFLIYFLIYFIAALSLLIYNTFKLPPKEAIKVKYILFGISLMGVVGGTTNILIPLLTNENVYATVGTYSTVLFAGFTYYSIVKHRLFDLRLIVARSLAYILVIFTLGLAYGFAVFAFIDDFFPGTRTTTLQQAIYTGLAVFMAFTFQPIKRFFDRLTDRIFYRDRYDSTEVLNSLGQVFISKINSFELLDDSLQIIVDAMKVEYGRFLVVKERQLYRTAHYGVGEDLEIQPADLSGLESRITDTDVIAESSQEHSLLQDKNINIVSRLTTSDGLIGYLILGRKRNGSIFTKQDMEFLEILSQELAVAIQNARSYEEISQFGDMMKREVLAATAKLRETNKRLVKLDEAKDEFISMASHQLRTPLTTVKGYLSMLLEGDAGKLTKRQAEFIDMSFVSSQRMVHLISDMLNVSRISTGRMTVDRAVFDLVKVVESEVEQLRRQAEARGIKLTLHRPKEKSIKVNLDEGKIRQVIMNFIDNAIYYCPEGKVDVYVESVGSDAEFRVEDNGIGVAESVQKQLFTKFFRSEKAKSVRPDGTGLGLYMAKQVIEIQGGEIIFKSVEGEGSTFGFRFALEDQKADK